LIKEYSKFSQLQEILIWEEKILIKELWTSSLKLSIKNITLIFLKIKELSKNLKEKLKKEKELYHQLLKSELKSKI